MIEIDHLTKRLGDTLIVDDVSMVVDAGTIAVVVGTSGAGKSTLLRMINRLIAPTSGRVVIDGQDTMSIPEDELRTLIERAREQREIVEDCRRAAARRAFASTKTR